MVTQPRPIERSVRFYRTLLKAYPAAFREEYEDEMTLVFHDLAADAWRRRGRVGLWMLWCRVLGDLLRTAPHEYAAIFHRRMKMKAVVRTAMWSLLAGLVYYVAFASVCMVFLILQSLSPTGRMASGLYHAGMEMVLLCLPAFISGSLLALVKSSFRPLVTSPLGAMAVWCLWMLVWRLTYTPQAMPFSISPWWVHYLQVALVAFTGFAAFLGCLATIKIRRRFWTSHAA